MFAHVTSIESILVREENTTFIETRGGGGVGDAPT